MSNSTYEVDEDRPLLTSRVVNSLPVVGSLWQRGLGLYNATKNSSTLFQAGFDLAERTAEPFVQRYKAIDYYASDKVDKVASFIPTTATVLQVAAYPVGYAYGIALGTMNAIESGVEGTSFERPLERVYDIADSLIDGVLPQDRFAEEISEFGLRSKNPVRRIGKRISLRSLRMLPSNTANFAVQKAKSYTQEALVNSIDYGVWLLYNRVDASYQRVERVAKLLLRLQFVRNLLAQSVNLYFERIDRYEIIKRLRLEGAHFIHEALTTILTQLDTIHALVLDNFPQTSEMIEKLSISIFNFQSLLEFARNKKRALPFDESEEERLKKREKVYSGKQEKGAWHKVVSKSKRHPAHIRHSEWPAVGTPASKGPQNPYAVLAKSAQKDTTQPKTLKAAHKEDEKKEEKKEAPVLAQEAPEEDASEQQETEPTPAQQETFKERARLEMERWEQQEREAQAEKKRQEHEQQLAAARAAKAQAQKEAEEEKARREKKLQKVMEKRVKEKQRADAEAQRANEKEENEQLQKQIAHLQASQAYRAAKASREADVLKRRKREEVERQVHAALAKRANEEYDASHTPEALADSSARQLMEEERCRLEAERRVQAEEREHAPKQAERKKAGKHKPEQKQPRQFTDKVIKEIKEEKKEVSIIGGTKVVDQHTDWVAHTEAEYSALTETNAQGVISPVTTGGAGI